jgi:hypothetical protein
LVRAGKAQVKHNLPIADAGLRSPTKKVKVTCKADNN